MNATQAQPIPDGSVIVTPASAPDELTMQVGAREIYDKVVEAASDIKEIKESRRDHETRIRALERWRYAVGGSALAAGGALVEAFRAKHGG